MSKNSNNSICYFAKTNFRSNGKPFGIQQKDRLSHCYIIGKTGAGKTNLLNTKILQDIHQGNGLCLFDVHGDIIQSVIESIPQKRQGDVVFLNATDPKLHIGYNPLRKVNKEKRPLLASNLLEVFQKLWGSQSWGVKLSHILRNVILTLLDQPRTNISDIPKLLHNASFRNQCLRNVESPDVITFWNKEFPKYSRTDLIPIFNKFGGLLSYPSVKRIFVDNPKQISLRQIMDTKKILLVNISKGSLGAEASYILGSLLLTSITSAAFSRIDTPEHKRQSFYLYLDEFHNYTNHSVVDMLSELRKFKVGLIAANQYLSQLDQKIRDAVLGNVGTTICFRLGYQDAKIMAKEFYPEFQTSDFVNLENYDIYLKLMINGRPSKAFSATTIHSSNYLLDRG